MYEKIKQGEKYEKRLCYKGTRRKGVIDGTTLRLQDGDACEKEKKKVTNVLQKMGMLFV